MISKLSVLLVQILLAKEEMPKSHKIMFSSHTNTDFYI